MRERKWIESNKWFFLSPRRKNHVSGVAWESRSYLLNGQRKNISKGHFVRSFSVHTHLHMLYLWSKSEFRLRKNGGDPNNSSWWWNGWMKRSAAGNERIHGLPPICLLKTVMPLWSIPGNLFLHMSARIQTIKRRYDERPTGYQSCCLPCYLRRYDKMSWNFQSCCSCYCCVARSI